MLLIFFAGSVRLLVGFCHSTALLTVKLHAGMTRFVFGAQIQLRSCWAFLAESNLSEFSFSLLCSALQQSVVVHGYTHAPSARACVKLCGALDSCWHAAARSSQSADVDSVPIVSDMIVAKPLTAVMHVTSALCTFPLKDSTLTTSNPHLAFHGRIWSEWFVILCFLSPLSFPSSIPC